MNNTGNAVPSTSPLDLQDNAVTLDQLINGDAIEVTSRTGKKLKGIAALQSIITSLDVSNFTFASITAGLAGTTSGQYFRVPQGTNSDIAFIYYLNASGTAQEVATLGSDNKSAISYLMDKTGEMANIDAKAISASYPELAYSGPIESMVIPEQGKKLIVLRDLSATSIDTRSYLRFDVTQNGNVISRYLPATLLIMQGGAAYSFYEPIDVMGINNGAIASADTMVRVEFDCGKTIDISDSSAFTVIDAAGVFAPGIASNTSYTNATVSGANGAGRIRFMLPVAQVTNAGYDPTSVTSLRDYILSLASESHILVKTNVWNKNVELSRYTQQGVQEGSLTVSCKAYHADGSESSSSYSLILSVYKDRADYSRYQSDFLRLTADVSNLSAYTYTGYPIELKVSFPVGKVKSDNGLVLLDDAGNEYPCQFSGERHPNKRLRTECSRHPDGSLAVGSIFYTDTLATAAKKNLELRAYTLPMRAMAQSSLVVVDSDTKTLSIGGYTYFFTRQQNWCLTSIKDPSGTTQSIAHSLHLAGISSNAVAETGANYMPSLRVINSGPVFVEVEHTIFNPAIYSLPAKGLRFVTRYRMFANGKVQIKVMCQSENEIATGILAGVSSRLTAKNRIYASAANAVSAWTTDATSGKVFAISGIRAAGDEHRDGTAYGPNRPAVATIIYPDNADTRLTLGWKIGSTSDYSFLNWKVKKDWVWVQEFWIDCETGVASNSAAAEVGRDVISLAYNRPVGFLGESGYLTAKKQKILSKITEHVFGTMEWWYSFDASSAGGMPYNDASADRVWTYAAISFDIMRHIKYGWSTVDKLYATLDKYIRWTYGAKTIAQIGDQYLAGKVQLQFSSRLCIGPLEWLYKVAVKEGNTTVKSNLEACIKNFADAMVTYFNAHSDVGFGIANFNANAMRVLALGIYAGQDSSGDYLSTFNKIEALITSTSTYLYVANVIKDAPNDVLTTRNWLNYQVFTLNSYACACYLLGKDPAINMTNYLLMASSARGGYHEIDYCVSESRRGSFNTYQMAMYNLMYAKSASAMNLAEKSMDLFTSEYGPAPGYPKRAFGFDGTTSETYAITDIPFIANGFADIWLREYFREIGDKNF